MDRDWDSARCTVLHWMQVNMQPYRFSSNLTLRTKKRRKQSTPTAMNSLQCFVTLISRNGVVVVITERSVFYKSNSYIWCDQSLPCHWLSKNVLARYPACGSPRCDPPSCVLPIWSHWLLDVSWVVWQAPFCHQVSRRLTTHLPHTADHYAQWIQFPDCTTP